MSYNGCPGPNGLRPEEWGCDATNCSAEYRAECWRGLQSKGYTPVIVVGDITEECETDDT